MVAADTLLFAPHHHPRNRARKNIQVRERPQQSVQASKRSAPTKWPSILVGDIDFKTTYRPKKNQNSRRMP